MSIETSTKATFVSSKSLFAAILIYVLVIAIADYRGLSFFPDGPYRRTAEVTRSIWNNGTLSPPEFTEIYKRASEHSLRTGTPQVQDVFALGKNGELYPKHSLFSCIFAVPFYGLFGEAGFRIAHGLLFLLLFFSLSCIAQRVCNKELSILTLCCLLLGTQAIFEIFRFSYDLHGTALIACAIALHKKYPSLSGLIAVGSYFVRPSNLLFAPFVLLMGFSSTKNKRWFLLFLLGSGFAALSILVTNYILFGQPLATAYHRLPHVSGEELVLSSHPIGFSLAAFFERWWEKLFDTTHGLIPYNLAFLLAPLSIWATFTQTARKSEFYLLVLAALSYSVYIFSYPIWEASHFGNRFMFPASCLFLIPLIVGINALLVKKKQ